MFSDLINFSYFLIYSLKKSYNISKKKDDKQNTLCIILLRVMIWIVIYINK